MFRRDFRDKVRYTIPFDIIIYIDSTAKAEEHMGNLVPALSNQEYIYFGFDVEGTSNPKSSSSDPSFETLQLHTEIDTRKFNFIFQLNRFGKRSILPPQLEFVLKLENNVFIGKIPYFQ